MWHPYGTYIFNSVWSGVCVRLSVTSRCSIETAGQVELVLACVHGSIYPTPCFKEIHVSAKIRVLWMELSFVDNQKQFC